MSVKVVRVVDTAFEPHGFSFNKSVDRTGLGKKLKKVQIAAAKAVFFSTPKAV